MRRQGRWRRPSGCSSTATPSSQRLQSAVRLEQLQHRERCGRTEVRPSWPGRSGTRHVALSAGHRVQRPRAGLDCRSAPGARAAGTGRVCRRLARSRRAHAGDRARLPDHRRAGRTRRRRPHGRADCRGWPAVARIPPAGRAAVDLRGDRRLRRGPARAGTATAVGQQGVPLRPSRPQGRRLRRARRPRHRRVCRAQADHARPRRAAAGVHGTPLSRRRQVVRARGAAGPGPEVHRARPNRRSTGWAGRRGRRRRRASRRRCATWRRSC